MVWQSAGLGGGSSNKDQSGSSAPDPLSTAHFRPLLLAQPEFLGRHLGYKTPPLTTAGVLPRKRHVPG